MPRGKSRPACSLDNCERPHKGRGLCQLHLARYKKTGSPHKLLDTKERHGLTGTKEYIAWFSMKQRCYTQSRRDYSRYGGRGIKVCEEWRNSFTTFLDYVGKAPSDEYTLDRIDCNGDYEPGNVRWATQITQQNNKSSNRRLAFREQNLTIAEWGRLLGVGKDTLRRRLESGWTTEQTLTIPVKVQSNNRNLQLKQ